MAGDLLSPERLGRRGLVDARAAGRLLDDHRSGRADHGLRLYGLLVLELWLDSLPRGAVAPAAAR